jgi:hypothetical protein
MSWRSPAAPLTLRRYDQTVTCAGGCSAWSASPFDLALRPLHQQIVETLAEELCIARQATPQVFPPSNPQHRRHSRQLRIPDAVPERVPVLTVEVRKPELFREQQVKRAARLPGREIDLHTRDHRLAHVLALSCTPGEMLCAISTCSRRPGLQQHSRLDAHCERVYGG